MDMGRSKNNVQRIALRPDGKILLAGGERNEVDGGFCVVRVNAKGKLDRTFADYGKLTIPLEGELRDIHILKDGKILLAGYINKGPDKDFVVIRLHEDGKVDSSFADNGKKVVNLGGTDEGRAIAIQRDGSILIAGNTYAQSWMQRDFVVVRLHPEGELDESFGNGGIKRIDIDKYDNFRDMVLQRDGKIIVAGYTKPGKFNEFAIFRLDTQGLLDPSFDWDGIKLMQVGVENSFCEGLALDEKGNILVAGHASTQRGKPGYDFIVTRLHGSGYIDQSFGQNGFAKIDLGGSEYASSLEIQSDGNLILLGSSHARLVAIRLTDGGKIDHSFGEKGMALMQKEEFSSDKASDLIIQPNGKILVAGVSNEQFILGRVVGNPFIQGMSKAMAFNWKKTSKNKEQYAGWEASSRFNIHAWIEGEQIPTSNYKQKALSGPKSLSPVGEFVTRRIYLSIGDNYKMTVIWDSADLIHFYVNGKFARTISLQMVASEDLPNEEKAEKPLPTQENLSNPTLRVQRGLH